MILTVERRAAIELRNQGVISDEILHRVEQELDVEAIRRGIGDLRLQWGWPCRFQPTFFAIHEGPRVGCRQASGGILCTCSPRLNSFMV